MEVRRRCAQQGVRAAVAVAALVFGGGHAMTVNVTRMALRHHHGPVAIHRVRDQTSSETYNWSGYAVTSPNGSVTDVKASWVVPSVTCPASSEGYSSFWTGIDGWTSNTVEQIGTDSDCENLAGTQAGVATYYAWFEFYPQYSYLIGNYTNAGACLSDCIFHGDVISAEVKSTGSGNKGPGPRGGQQFMVTISDLTQHWSFTTTSAVPGAKQSSAEWIAETPYGCNTSSGFCPLANFGTVDYGDDDTHVASTSYATVNGKTQAIGSFGKSVQEAIMVADSSGNALMVQPSSLSTDGTSFSATWYNPGP